MKVTRTLLLMSILILLAPSAKAVDWKDRYGIGIRGPLFIPLNEGNDFTAFGGYEPYMMGPYLRLDLRRGLTKNFVFDLSFGYAVSYDDTTADANQSFKLYSKDNAFTRLNGIITGFTGQYYFRSDKSLQPYILAGIGIDYWRITVLDTRPAVDPAVKDTKYRFSDLSLKLGAGINFWLGESFTFDLQARMNWDVQNLNTTGRPLSYLRASDKDARPFNAYLEPTIGITYYYSGRRDTDKDGVSDNNDLCPDTPLGAIVDAGGCPIDSDNDGVFDGIDTCPETPAGALVDITGCPLDIDKDGVPDGIDRCPNTPIGVKVDVRGCPLDSDGDQVPDYKDKCPDTPAGLTVDVNGCPIDSDGDGITDDKDRCPTTPAGTVVDSVGCPINIKPPVKKITLNIKYATGSYEPDPASKKILDDLAQTMKAYTDMKIEIRGFTDNIGSEESNMLLSQKRANAVLQYLLNQGVESSRMTATGFGENPEYFVADNSTAAGRQANRRVEILSLEQ